RFRGHDSVAGNRRWRIAVLVAQQPLRRILRAREAHALGSRKQRAAGRLRSLGGPRFRFLERKRRNRCESDGWRTVIAGVGKWRAPHSNHGFERTRSTRAPLAAISAGWKTLLIYRARRSIAGYYERKWDLCWVARFERLQTDSGGSQLSSDLCAAG